MDAERSIDDERYTSARARASGSFTVGSEREGDVQTIRPRGELDMATAAELQRELERVECGDAVSIVIDLSGLTFIDSSGVRLLVQAQTRSRADHGRLMLLRGPRAVQRVFELTATQALLPFAD